LPERVDISANGRTGLKAGSVVVIDSTITNTPVGIITAFDSASSPTVAGSLILENVVLKDVATAVQQAGGGLFWPERLAPQQSRDGRKGTSTSRTDQKVSRCICSSYPAGNVYYSRSKPQYSDLPASSFQSVRTAGAVGDGKTDDTNNLQHAINSASAAGKVVYFDSGTWKITYTLFIPAGTRLVGEAYPIIMPSGNFFNDMNNTKPVVQVGNAGQASQVEWTDMIVST
jgi:glucan 1,3-beta-glucosidase